MTRLETIKNQMRENIEELIKFQNMQLKAFEEILSCNSIDEVDEIIQDKEWEFKFSTTLNDIVCEEKENFKKLIDLAWEEKSHAN